MNEYLHDPTLRSFRMPIAHRLRLRIDTLRDTCDAQTHVIAKQGREINRLQKELRKSNREVVKSAAEIRCLRLELRCAKEGGNADDIAA